MSFRRMQIRTSTLLPVIHCHPSLMEDSGDTAYSAISHCPPALREDSGYSAISTNASYFTILSLIPVVSSSITTTSPSSISSFRTISTGMLKVKLPPCLLIVAIYRTLLITVIHLLWRTPALSSRSSGRLRLLRIPHLMPQYHSDSMNTSYCGSTRLYLLVKASK